MRIPTTATHLVAGIEPRQQHILMEEVEEAVEHFKEEVEEEEQ